MRITNPTPFKLFPQNTRSPDGEGVVFIVKGTFTLPPEGTSAVAKTQRELSADKVFLDDVGRSLAWASDLAPYKPHFDFYVHGAFHAPEGRAVRDGEVGFSLGPLRKRLLVFGPRHAYRMAEGGWHVSAPEPVLRVPLRWEYSFGSLTDDRNPFGMGVEEGTDERGRPCVPLPLIEHPDDPLRFPGPRPAPANLAPVPASFRERRRKRGTRDRRWATFRAPLPPLDYDPSHENAAPGDQQAANFPRGDEVLSLHNMHPAHPRIACRLPGLRLRAGLLRLLPDRIAAEEVTMNLDTVVALPDEGEMVLLWRGRSREGEAAALGRPVLCELLAEPLDGEPAPFDAIAARMKAAYIAGLPPGPEKLDAAIAKVTEQVRAKAAATRLPKPLADLLASGTDPGVMFEALVKHAEDLAETLRRGMR